MGLGDLLSAVGDFDLDTALELVTVVQEYLIAD